MSDDTTKADTKIAGYDRTQEADSAVLDTGMTVAQAVKEAMIWWEAIGRKEMRANHTSKRRGRRKGKPGFITANPTTDAEFQNSLPSGILNAKAWTDLTREEQLIVVRQWHHHHIRLPLGVNAEGIKRVTAVEGKCFYCAQPGVVVEDLPNGESREMCQTHWRDRYPHQFNN